MRLQTIGLLIFAIMLVAVLAGCTQPVPPPVQPTTPGAVPAPTPPAVPVEPSGVVPVSVAPGPTAEPLQADMFQNDLDKALVDLDALENNTG